MRNVRLISFFGFKGPYVVVACEPGKRNRVFVHDYVAECSVEVANGHEYHTLTLDQLVARGGRMLEVAESELTYPEIIRTISLGS
jgi:hypothetical protein